MRASACNQAGLSQPARKRKIDFRNVRLVNHVPLHATGEAVFVDGYHRVLAHVEAGGERLGACADAIDGEPVLAHVVQADGAEIDGQFAFDAAHHHLEDAAQILAFADAMCNA